MAGYCKVNYVSLDTSRIERHDRVNRRNYRRHTDDDFPYDGNACFNFSSDPLLNMLKQRILCRPSSQKNMPKSFST